LLSIENFGFVIQILFYYIPMATETDVSPQDCVKTSYKLVENEEAQVTNLRQRRVQPESGV